MTMNGTTGIRHDDYVANDSQGLTSTSTRTVIVEPATVPLAAPSADAIPATTTPNEEATKPSTVMQEKHTGADFLAPALS
jgi:hypothetical protein